MSKEYSDFPLMVPFEYYQEYLAHIAFKRAMGRKYETFEEYITSRKILVG